VTLLSGKLVIDLSRALAGPHAAMMLGDLGARVIKVESRFGDDSRSWGPPFVTPVHGAREATYFLAANRNKESIVLDLKTADGISVLRQLIARADVLIENFRPGVMDKLGLTTDSITALNPRLVTLSVTGFGHDGPEGSRAGYDQIAQGEAGLMSLTGSTTTDPQRTGVPIGDLLAGMYGAFGIVCALLERETTGVGQVVRTSLLAALVASHAMHGTAWTVAGLVGSAQGNHHPSIAPYGLFKCAGGAIQLSCGSENLWVRLCVEFGLDPQGVLVATNADRVAHRGYVIELLEGIFASFTADELLARLSTAGVPAGRIRSIDEVYEWEQTLSQGLVVGVEHETLGQIDLPGPPLRFFSCQDGAETEREIRKHEAPPVLDAHGAAIRDWLSEDLQ
jgi:crotonobetainyl-CoA:carnitine CoA-transferase CaiB-like acyl-CoA transferase